MTCFVVDEKQNNIAGRINQSVRQMAIRPACPACQMAVLKQSGDLSILYIFILYISIYFLF